jgi:hypothetical protein
MERKLLCTVEKKEKEDEEDFFFVFSAKERKSLSTFAEA